MLVHDKDMLLAIGEENPDLSAADLLNAWETQMEIQPGIESSAALFAIYEAMTSDPLGILGTPEEPKHKEIEWGEEIPLDAFYVIMENNPSLNIAEIIEKWSWHNGTFIDGA